MNLKQYNVNLKIIPFAEPLTEISHHSHEKSLVHINSKEKYEINIDITN